MKIVMFLVKLSKYTQLQLIIVMLKLNGLVIILQVRKVFELSGVDNKCYLKTYRLSESIFFFLLKVANIRCFILIEVEIFHNIIRK